MLPILLAAFVTPARADERILYFLSDVSVARNGSLDIVETIRLRAEGEAINHGIFRDFPTRYKGAGGARVRAEFTPIEVLRDGQPEPWTQAALSNGVRLRIGDADRLLPPGEHEYRIHYRTNRQLGFFEGYDELYWNATGTDWKFPIDTAEARIRLPQAVNFGSRAVYTGAQGASGHDARVVAELPDQIIFRTTEPLAEQEGLTVAVAWPKGIIAPPGAEARANWWLQDYAPPLVGALSLLGLCLFYFVAWRKAGRGPPPGTIVPLFTPPDELSAASMRYIVEMGADNRTFAAALVELGVRGKLRLVEGEKHFFSKPKTTIYKAEGGEPLPPPENALYDALFVGGDTIVMENKNHETFAAAQNALSKQLKKQYEGKLFLRNWGCSIIGLLLLFAAIATTAVALVLAAPLSSPGYLFGPIALAAALILYASSGTSTPGWRLPLKIFAVLAAVIAAAVGLAALAKALDGDRPYLLFVPMLALPIVISGFWWMAAPTRAGRAVLDRIAGFKQYLSITEEERLERMHPPEKTPELFEKYLPYAIALEVENSWAKQFENVLASAAAAGSSQAMTWYSGHSDPWRDPGDFVDDVGSSLSSTVASASTAPGSSSGSGGGGFSGGGGGGGGGGGW